jgi:Tol biopolymer transport system component
MSWTNDGEHVVFIKDGDAYRIRSDGSDEPELLLDRERALSRAFIAPDGERLFFQEGPGAWDIGVANLDEPGSDSLILSGDYWEGHPALSPDGRWLAYYSNESGQSEIFIRPLYGPGRRHQVSRDGGSRPRWSDDGTELFFTQDTRLLFVASLEVGDDIRVANVELLFEVGGQNYDVFPGDSLFAILDVPGDDEAAPDVATVVLNFDAELRRLAGGH